MAMTQIPKVPHRTGIEEAQRLLTAPERILVIRAGALGDTLMTTPLIRALRRRYPAAGIDFLCSALAAPLLELNPHLDELHRLRWRNLPIALSWEKRMLIHRLRRRRYDVVLLLESNPRYAVIAERVAPGRVVYPKPQGRETVHYAAHCLRCAGLPESEDLAPEMHLTADDGARAEGLLAGLPRPRIGVHCGYGPRGRSRKRGQTERLKGWPTERFVSVCRTLTEQRAVVVLTGSREDAPDTRQIAAALPAALHRNLAGRTSVRELAAVISRLDAMVSVDSFPAHMAATAGTPLVVLWGPGILEQCRPLSSRSPVEVLRHPVWCAPCYGTPLKEVCRDNTCMQGITSEAVVAAVTGLLVAAGKPA